MHRFVSLVTVFRKPLVELMRWHQARWLRLNRFLYLAIASVLVFCFFVQGCLEKTSTLISQKELQSMVNKSFLSPQIRVLDAIPGVSVQLYLETPKLFIIGGQQPLTFKFNAQVEADIFGSPLNESLSLAVEGTAELSYNEADYAFYFQYVNLQEARIDMQIAIFETLIMEKLRKELTREISNVAIIILNDNSPLLNEINGRTVNTSVTAGGDFQLSYGTTL